MPGHYPDHLRHRVKNGATGLHSGEPVLYCALCLQPPKLAQGRDLLNSVPEDAAVGIKYLETSAEPACDGCGGTFPTVAPEAGADGEEAAD